MSRTSTDPLTPEPAQGLDMANTTPMTTARFNDNALLNDQDWEESPTLLGTDRPFTDLSDSGVLDSAEHFSRTRSAVKEGMRSICHEQTSGLVESLKTEVCMASSLLGGNGLLVHVRNDSPTHASHPEQLVLLSSLLMWGRLKSVLQEQTLSSRCVHWVLRNVKRVQTLRFGEEREPGRKIKLRCGEAPTPQTEGQQIRSTSARRARERLKTFSLQHLLAFPTLILCVASTNNVGWLVPSNHTVSPFGPIHAIRVDRYISFTLYSSHTGRPSRSLQEFSQLLGARIQQYNEQLEGKLEVRTALTHAVHFTGMLDHVSVTIHSTPCGAREKVFLPLVTKDGDMIRSAVFSNFTVP
eukprot:9488372-Pyramimonas_sp.AAC.1